MWESSFITKYTYNWNHSLKKKKPWGDFPGGSMVKNPPSNAGNTGSNQRSGTKIPQAMCHGQEIFFFLSLKLPLKKQLLVMVDTANCHFVLWTLLNWRFLMKYFVKSSTTYFIFKIQMLVSMSVGGSHCLNKLLCLFPHQ